MMGEVLKPDRTNNKVDIDAEMSKLKPCPFCGGEAKIEEIGAITPNGTRAVRVYCDNFSVNGHERNDPCPMGFLSQIFNSRKLAIAAWNSRKPEGR